MNGRSCGRTPEAHTGPCPQPRTPLARRQSVATGRVRNRKAKTVGSQTLTPVSPGFHSTALIPLWLVLWVGIVEFFPSCGAPRDTRHTVTRRATVGDVIAVAERPPEVTRNVRPAVLAVRLLDSCVLDKSVTQEKPPPLGNRPIPSRNRKTAPRMMRNRSWFDLISSLYADRSASNIPVEAHSRRFSG